MSPVPLTGARMGDSHGAAPAGGEGKHTPEPWCHEGQGDIVGANNDDACVAYLRTDNGDANARRIVACVNACTGVPTEILEFIGRSGSFSRDDLVKHVEKQRDELLAALYMALPFVEDATDDPCYKQGIVKKAVYDIRSAIARVEVEKCKTCGGEGGFEAAASSTSYFWKDCPDCASVKGGAK